MALINTEAVSNLSPFQGISSIQVRQLKESAAQAFQILEPWFHAQPIAGTAAVQEIQILIAGIRSQGFEFVKAIDLSLEAGQHVLNFANDLDMLWQSIAAGADPIDIDVNIRELRRYACEAHKSVQETLQRFEQVRRNIFELTRTIPLTAELLLLKMDKINRSEKRHSLAAKVAYKTATLLRDAAIASAAAPSPIVMIILPVTLPILSLLAKKIGDVAIQRASERRMEQVSLDQVAFQLEKANDDLNKVLGHLKSFTIWWTGAETELDCLSNRLKTSASEVAPMLTLSKKRVEEVSEQFGEYLSEICKLKDYHFYPRDGPVDRTICNRSYAYPGAHLMCPQKAITAMSEELIKWESAFSTLRRAAESASRKGVQNVSSRLDEIKDLMAIEFRSHGLFLRHISVSVVDHWVAKRDRPGDETKEMAVSCLEKHISTSRLISDYIPQLRSYFSHKTSRRSKRLGRLNFQLEVSPVSPDPDPLASDGDKRFLQRAVSMHSNPALSLDLFESCVENVGTLCSVLALSDYSQAIIDRKSVEEAMAAFSHLH